MKVCSNYFYFLLKHTDEGKTLSGDHTTRTNLSVRNNAQNTPPVSSNGLKHSKFQRPDTEQSNVPNSQFPGGF